MLQLIKSSEIPSIPIYQFDENDKPILTNSTDSLFILLINPSYILTKKKYLAAFGGFTFNLMTGGYLAVGNFIPYLASYLTAASYNFNISECNTAIKDEYASNTAICNWLLTAFTLGYAGMGTVGGLIQLYWNWSTRAVVFLGGSIMVSQYLFTYYYTSNIYIILLCSFGVFFGVGCGLSWGPSIVCVIKWFPEKKAFMTGILMSAVACGSIFYSLIESLYINPTKIGNNGLCGYSLHPVIVDKVPGSFLLLSIFSAGCTLIGAGFLFDKQPENINQNFNENINVGHTKKDSMEMEIEVDDQKALSDDDMAGYYPIDNINMTKNEWTVKEAVVSIQFWIIFGNVLFNVYVLAFTYSDWKLFSQNYIMIEDENFLLTLNVVAAICNFFGRIIWGSYYDYIKSYKTTMITVTVCLFSFMVTLPLCMNKVMAFIWVSALWFGNAATYTIMPPAISDTFGDKYCAILTGVMMLAEIVSTGLMSLSFTIVQSLGFEEHERWIVICLINATFAGISTVIATKIKFVGRKDGVKGFQGKRDLIH